MISLIIYRNYFRSVLASLYQQGEIDDFFKRGIAHYFDWNSLKIGLEPNYKLAKTEKIQLDALLEGLKKGMPIQYIFGVSNFRGMDLEVNEAVLIPRPETEELVEWVLMENSQENTRLWDLCTGAGCIALAIQFERQSWNISAGDLSEEALLVAQNNAQKHQLPVDFHRVDVLKWRPLGTQCDIIVSNPPYVFPSEKKQMHKNVLGYEPHMALFVPEEDPLCFYAAILAIAKEELSPDGVIYFEINPKTTEALVTLGKSFNFKSAVTKKDIFGKERFVKFSKR